MNDQNCSSNHFYVTFLMLCKHQERSTKQWVSDISLLHRTRTARVHIILEIVKEFDGSKKMITCIHYCDLGINSFAGISIWFNENFCRIMEWVSYLGNHPRDICSLQLSWPPCHTLILLLQTQSLIQCFWHRHWLWENNLPWHLNWEHALWLWIFLSTLNLHLNLLTPLINKETIFVLSKTFWFVY